MKTKTLGNATTRRSKSMTAITNDAYPNIPATCPLAINFQITTVRTNRKEGPMLLLWLLWLI